MISDSAWIRYIDHRISSALIFFVLLLFLNSGPRKKNYVPRMVCTLLCMCAASWTVRYFTDAFSSDIRLQGLGYSLQILVLYFMFLMGNTLCYKVRPAEISYNAILALTIYKAAWNTFKTGSSIFAVNAMNALWSEYSVIGSAVSYFVYFQVCFFLSLLYKKLVKEPPYHAPTRVMASLSTVFILIQIVLEYCGHVFTGTTSALFLYYLCALLYTALNYAALLMIAALDSFRHENRTMHDFINNKMRYYEMSHEGIVSLQTKCHDLKHQIHAIRTEVGKSEFEAYLNEIEDSIDEYSTVIECGNKTIDIVLTEKNILCHSCHVKFSYMIDGSLFHFLSEKEIYSLFGNALDNALEATEKVEDVSKRMISLKSNPRGELVVLQIENTYEGDLMLQEDRLPKTTKTTSGHGFGLRSIQEIAQRHGGAMSIRAENGIFKLSILLHSSLKA